MCLVAIALYALVLAMISADWVAGTWILLWSAPLGLLAGFLVAKSRSLPQPLLHLAAFFSGYWLAFALTAGAALHTPWTLLLADLRALLSSGTGPGLAVVSSEHIFLLYLCFLSFFLGYLGSWLTYRARLPWLVALTYCSIMLVNLQYSRQASPLLLPLMLGALLLLIGRLHLATLLDDWHSLGLFADHSWLRSLLGRNLALTSLLVLLSLLPSLLLPPLIQPNWGSQLWQNLDALAGTLLHQRLFGPVPSGQLSSQEATVFFGERLTVSGSVLLPAGSVLEYSGSAAPAYLEAVTYNQFDGHSWTSTTQSQARHYAAEQPLPADTADGHYRQVVAYIRLLQVPQSARSYLFAPPQPVRFSVPVTIYGERLPSAWAQQGSLRPGERYTAVARVPVVDASSLARVPLLSVDPHFWQSDPALPILERDYLQLPASLPHSLMQTALAWTQGAHNAFEAMQLLVSHLSDPRQFSYSISNPPIPSHVDVVSWLLQTHSGYCTYYASAMVVMARLLGMPARMVVGFSQGHYDAGRQVWVVNGSDAHSWVQVYFPGHGWIDFDPTPGFALGPAFSGTPLPSPSSSPSNNGATPAGGQSDQPGTAATPAAHHTTPAPRSPLQTVFSSPWPLLALVILTGLGLLVLVLATVAALWWRRLDRQTSPVARLFWRLCRLASLAGLRPRSWQTPYEYSARLSQAMPEVASPLRRLTELFVRERWAPPYELPGSSEKAELERLWPPLRRGLLRLWLRRFI
uniref:Transglutaminase n=1 Tax=Thermogemmatispora argillosa TaxID=2045280 RepID=A0A455SWZ1_9CHLR|nr:transglutaminase [Thermogemmatispora argillosa]